MNDALKHQYLWVDLETTGLDPHADFARILEWAVVFADDARGGDLSPVAQYTSAVHWPDAMPTGILPPRTLPGGALRAACDSFVQQMHDRNGLWRDVANPATASLADAEDFLLSIVPAHGKTRLAGASVHFDIGWLRVNMPRLAPRLHHQVLDVSALWCACRSWGPDVEGASRETHRALPDILATLEDARRLRDAMGWAP